nr:hypothetical protein [Tanacetum cinerariifolium]
MNDPNITMEEYIKLEEEKAWRRVFNDAFTSEVTPSYEPTVSPLNDNKIDFRISFDGSDDEDYMVIYDENSFSYKIISVNDLKTDSKNDKDKVNMLSFSSPEPEDFQTAASMPRASSDTDPLRFCGICFLPSVFLTTDVGWLRGACLLVLMKLALFLWSESSSSNFQYSCSYCWMIDALNLSRIKSQDVENIIDIHLTVINSQKWILKLNIHGARPRP